MDITILSAMEARCAVVETWAEFGCPSPGTAAKVIWSGEDVLICTGGDEVSVFNTQELKLTTVLQFLSPVCHMVLSEDKQSVYAVCESDGVYCVSLPTLHPKSPTPTADQSPGPALIKVLSNSLAARDEGVCSLIEVGGSGGTLVTVSLRDAAWWFTLYKAADHQKLTQFSLPVVSAGHHVESEENGSAGLVMRPVLACVYSSDAPPLSSSSSSTTTKLPPLSSSLGVKHFLLEPLLFKLLFGVDAALINSPMILCGLPDGRLCSLPLLLPGRSDPCVRVLHSMEQPIMFIGTTTGTNYGPQCLVAVGQWGRVVLVRTCEGGPEEGGKVAALTEGCVSGPVVCVCAGREGLYYSTGSDLLALDLSGVREEPPKPEESLVVGHRERQGQGQAMVRARESATLQSPVSLNVCRVIALAGPSHNASGIVQLVALSLRGRLQRLTLPKGTETGGIPRLPLSQVGQRVRDLLAAIGDVCERASVLKSTIQSKNHSLRHLNQVLNVCCLLLANQNSGEQLPVSKKPIRCHVVAKWSRLLQRDSLNLTCVLDNSSPYILERNWMFCVRVLPLSYPLPAGGVNTSQTFSFPFQKLEPGGRMEVSLPLTVAGDTSFPVTVSCSLTYSLQSLLGSEELSRLLANGEPASRLGLEGGWVSLPLDTLTVDWLDALQVTGTTPPHRDPNRPPISPDTVSMDIVEAFVSTRRSRGSGRGGGEGGGERMVASDGGLFSASIKVSTELLRGTLGLEPAGSAGPSQGVCGSVLGWLLSQGTGGEDWRGRGDNGGQESSVVYARCLGRHTVKLTAKEVTVGDTSVKEAVEVRVQCSSMAAVCGLHHAVLSRVQALLQGNASTQESSMGVQGLGLRQALQRAQVLSEHLQEARIPEAIGLGMTTGQTTKTLFSVYRQLRENPLLIL
ncbi:Fanconi anemia core complex-associated protein 100 isoform X2 [Oncorhynchus tshawytscha]|uniref:FA core complex associated protein 100 n=1 Tax=Oncorhynchus tshawytscha TaxID=74940 RepID=A0A8C8CAC4_ONCTS|nr:Fanconi anemia core complex-associated protein 100 isoform X2 [Oncorhynchus tshawytscha]